MPAVAAWPYKRNKAVIQTQIEERTRGITYVTKTYLKNMTDIGLKKKQKQISWGNIRNLLAVLHNLQLDVMVKIWE